MAASCRAVACPYSRRPSRTVACVADTDDTGENGNGDGDDSGGAAGGTSERPPVRKRHQVRWLVSAVLLAATVAVTVDRRHDLVAALRLLSVVHPARVGAAAALEALSLACLAALQWWLLRVGGRRLGIGVVGAMVLAGNAIAGTLPAGTAFAAAWLFGQLRRRGVPQVLAASALAVAGLLSSLALFVLLVAGVLGSGARGPGGLRVAVLWAAVVLLVSALGGLALSRFAPVRRRVRRAWRRIGVRSRRMWSIEEGLTHLVRQVRTRRPGPRPWLTSFVLALLNWVLDAACLAVCAWALAIAPPWRGMLVAYTLTQMTGALRLTPGGLGIVETSLAALLVYYGLHADQAIAVTLLYRIVSYWALQPVGWASWLGLTIASRHRETPAPD